MNPIYDNTIRVRYDRDAANTVRPAEGFAAFLRIFNVITFKIITDELRTSDFLKSTKYLHGKKNRFVYNY